MQTKKSRGVRVVRKPTPSPHRDLQELEWRLKARVFSDADRVRVNAGVDPRRPETIDAALRWVRTQEYRREAQREAGK